MSSVSQSKVRLVFLCIQVAVEFLPLDCETAHWWHLSVLAVDALDYFLAGKRKANPPGVDGQ